MLFHYLFQFIILLNKSTHIMTVSLKLPALIKRPLAFPSGRNRFSLFLVLWSYGAADLIYLISLNRFNIIE